MSNSARNKQTGNGSQQPSNKIPFIGALRPVELIGIGLLVFAAMMYGLSKCSGDKKPAGSKTVQTDSSGVNSTALSADDQKVDALRRRLYVVMDSLRMRRAPHKDSVTVKFLPYGEELIDMGEYENEQTIKISPEYSATEPWIKVKTKDGRTGWVFGAYVRTYPKKRPAPEPEKKTEEKATEKATDKKTESKSGTKTDAKSENKSGNKTDSKTTNKNR